MSSVRYLPGVLALGLLYAATIADADAVPIVERTASLKVDKFGSLTQSETECRTVSCGPVAAVNTLVYLQNTQAAVYDEKLLKDKDPVKTANALLAADYMNTSCTILCTHGTYWEEYLFGKARWIEGLVSGKTIYRAETKFEWGKNYDLPEDRKEAFALTLISDEIHLDEKTNPSWAFLYYSLKDGWPVEMLITFEDESGHYLTPYTFSWKDLDGDLVVDKDENAKLGYIDPAATDLLHIGEAHFWQDSKGALLQFDYGEGDAARRASVTFVTRVSVVPEPTSMLLLLAGIASLWALPRARHRRRGR